MLPPRFVPVSPIKTLSTSEHSKLPMSINEIRQHDLLVLLIGIKAKLISRINLRVARYGSSADSEVSIEDLKSEETVLGPCAMVVKISCSVHFNSLSLRKKKDLFMVLTAPKCRGMQVACSSRDIARFSLTHPRHISPRLSKGILRSRAVHPIIFRTVSDYELSPCHDNRPDQCAILRKSGKCHPKPQPRQTLGSQLRIRQSQQPAICVRYVV